MEMITQEEFISNVSQIKGFSKMLQSWVKKIFIKINYS